MEEREKLRGTHPLSHGLQKHKQKPGGKERDGILKSAHWLTTFIGHGNLMWFLTERKKITNYFDIRYWLLAQDLNWNMLHGNVLLNIWLACVLICAHAHTRTDAHPISTKNVFNHLQPAFEFFVNPLKWSRFRYNLLPCKRLYQYICMIVMLIFINHKLV